MYSYSLNPTSKFTLSQSTSFCINECWFHWNFFKWQSH